MKRAILTAALVAVCLSLTVCGCADSPSKVFKKKTGVKLPAGVKATTVDTTEFFGDGELIYTFYVSKDDADAFKTTVSTTSHWQPLPLSKEVEELVYEHFTSFSARAEDGYYFFYDEQNKSYTLPEDYAETSYSYDFVFGLYDSAEHVAYYYEQHT